MVVVGSGPNGLTAAVRLARAGFAVRVLEAKQTPGGGARTEQLTIPGFHHDVCSAIHPTALISPAFRELDLAGRGVRWIFSPIELAHPFDDGSAAILLRSIDETAARLGEDGRAWLGLFLPFLDRSDSLFHEILRPIRLPRSPGLLARFAVSAMQPAEGLARSRFRTPRARALFAGCAAHSAVPLDRLGTASFGLVLALAAHAAGWPSAERGSASITAALVSILRDHAGAIETGREVTSLAELGDARAVVFDLTPRQLVAIAGPALPSRYRSALARYRYGPGTFKIDWALDAPVPWTAPECRSASTVHLGGTLEEIVRAEREVGENRHPERPFVLFAQQSVFDPTRAPEGRHTGWAYCHVPHRSSEDMTGRIEAQIERFAPGFRDRILARRTRTSAATEADNPNMIGGDIGGGANDLLQFLFRPAARWNPYTTPDPRLFLGSSSTPPGGGVHGMCGHQAAGAVLASAS